MKKLDCYGIYSGEGEEALKKTLETFLEEMKSVEAPNFENKNSDEENDNSDEEEEGGWNQGDDEDEEDSEEEEPNVSDTKKND